MNCRITAPRCTTRANAATSTPSAATQRTVANSAATATTAVPGVGSSVNPNKTTAIASIVTALTTAEHSP